MKKVDKQKIVSLIEDIEFRFLRDTKNSDSIFSNGAKTKIYKQYLKYRDKKIDEIIKIANTKKE